jgi:hypothetical protein
MKQLLIWVGMLIWEVIWLIICVYIVGTQLESKNYILASILGFIFLVNFTYVAYVLIRMFLKQIHDERHVKP